MTSQPQKPMSQVREQHLRHAMNMYQPTNMQIYWWLKSRDSFQNTYKNILGLTLGQVTGFQHIHTKNTMSQCKVQL